jgi:hypothetical protein
MVWSMDAQSTSPTGRSLDPEPSAPTAHGGATGARGIAGAPADTTPANATPATATQGIAEHAPVTPAAAAQDTKDTKTPATPVAATQNTTTRTPTAQAADAKVPASTSEVPHRAPGFRERGRMRRRLRFLRKARELAYRDLGGLVFEMHRLGQRHDELVAAKLEMLERFDGELRTLEAALRERRPVTVLREAGIAACPRCAAIHGSADGFCPACGMPMGPHADRPIAATPAPPPPVAPPTAPTPASAVPAPASSPFVPPPQAANPPASADPQRAPARYPSASPTVAAPSEARTPRAPTPPPASTTPRTPRPTPPKPTEDDRPTEIIRPSDGTA